MRACASSRGQEAKEAGNCWKDTAAARTKARGSVPRRETVHNRGQGETTAARAAEGSIVEKKHKEEEDCFAAAVAAAKKSKE